MPTVSVVIPCYNYGRYLAECVRSALDQPDVRVDVVIVDDCSPDGSGDVADALAANDSRISVIRHTQNRGHIATYNDGIDAAKGEFLALVSADDLLTPGSLTRAVALLVSYSTVGLVYGNAVHFVGTPPAPRTDARFWIIWSGTDWLAARCRTGHNVITSPEVVMRTAISRQIGGYLTSLPHSGDLEMWLRTASVCDIGYVGGADQAMYRVHEANMHTVDFKSESFEGELIDLQQRAMSFDEVFSAPPASNLADAAQLHAVARRTLAIEALERTSYAFARGYREFPVDAFETAARKLDPQVFNSASGRGYLRRKSLGMVSLPLHPLWAPSAIRRRVRGRAIRNRMRRIGL
jgi:hypothetical protein